MAISAALQKKIDAMSPEQLKELEQYVEDCEARMGAPDDEAAEEAKAAEAQATGGKTMLHNAYRGTK